jgi:MFS family permease
VGAVAIAFVSDVWQAFGATGLAGLGAGLAWPALNTLLARLTPAEQLSGVFALRNTTLNVALVVGLLSSALIADVAHPGSFGLLYALDAASFVAAIALLWLVRPTSRSRAVTEGPGEVATPPAKDDSPGASGGYAVVWRDGVFVRLWVLVAILVSAGFAQFTAALPVLVMSGGGGASLVGLCFAANAVTVSACQLVVLKLARGRRRTRGIRVLCVLWALCWVLVLAGGRVGAGMAGTFFILATVVFGLGETLYAPTLPALVNDIAPEDVRGRYNGAIAFAGTTGFALGPALTGLLLQHHLGAQLLLGLMLACAAAAALAGALRRRLPEGVDVIGLRLRD